MLRHQAFLLLAALSGLAGPMDSRAADADVPEGKTRLEYAAGCGSCRTYREHAPLAYFSLGSLAVGGVFYGIHASRERSGPMSGNGARMEMAVGAAGLTALAAGAAYLYYALRGEAGDPAVPSADASAAPPAGSGAALEAMAGGASAGPFARLGVGMAAGGGLAASVVLPLSSLLD